MNEIIIQGFNEEMEKVAILGTVLKLGKLTLPAIKGMGRFIAKNPLNTGLMAYGATAGAQRAISALPKVRSKLPGMI